MTLANEDIRKAAKQAGVRMWRIADELGIQDSVLSRKLRYELSEEQKRKIFMIIDRLAKEAG